METLTSRITASLVGTLLGAPISAQVTQRVSVSSSAAEGNDSSYASHVSADARYVAFMSDATNLVPGDTNGSRDVFVRTRYTGTTQRVSVSSNGTQGNGTVSSISISGDGRFVALMSTATNLVPGDANGATDIFVHDRQFGTTELVSVASNGAQGNDHSYSPSLSYNGRFVAFWSRANNLVPVDANSQPDVFVHDRLQGTTEVVSVASSGTQSDGHSEDGSISGDGRFVAFWSEASNLVPGDTNGHLDAFVRDRQLGVTERISVDSAGAQANGESLSPSISPDGRYVAFASVANNLVSGDANILFDVFIRDRLSGTTTIVSVTPTGAPGNFAPPQASVSENGRFVAFSSSCYDLVPDDTNDASDVFVRDIVTGTTTRVNLDPFGSQADSWGSGPSISADGRFVAFSSPASDLVRSDTNDFMDVFVHDRDASGFTSICDPGSSGIATCPCSNPQSGTGRGCDNSAGTGGAILSASGVSYLTMDSLVFTTNGEKPSALSLVLQGNSLLPTGLVYGQGVHCAGGSLKKLYVKHASGGSITAPEAGDPSVSARSIALGVPIAPGQRRWYLVSYRDPVVLGGCPVTSTFNATQTARVLWSL